MDIDEAIRKPHDLTCARLEAFCQYVDLADGTIKKLLLSRVVRAGETNDLTPLDGFRCRSGVYAFQLCGCVIYVGKCGTATSNQGLRGRISQHLSECDTGGTFRINWLRCHDGWDFGHFESMVTRCHLWTISYPQSEDTQRIARLEHLLIGVLGPKYCDVSP